jgi:hypothetical protein
VKSPPLPPPYCCPYPCPYCTLTPSVQSPPPPPSSLLSPMQATHGSCVSLWCAESAISVHSSPVMNLKREMGRGAHGSCHLSHLYISAQRAAEAQLCLSRCPSAGLDTQRPCGQVGPDPPRRPPDCRRRPFVRQPQRHAHVRPHPAPPPESGGGAPGPRAAKSPSPRPLSRFVRRFITGLEGTEVALTMHHRDTHEPYVARMKRAPVG